MGTVLTFLKAAAFFNSRLAGTALSDTKTATAQFKTMANYCHPCQPRASFRSSSCHFAVFLREKIWHYRQHSPGPLPYKMWYTGNFGTTFVSHRSSSNNRSLEHIQQKKSWVSAVCVVSQAPSVKHKSVYMMSTK